MPINITDRSDILDPESRRLTERRLLFAMSRFSSRIKNVKLVVADENGPRGGVDKCCRLSVALYHATDVVISDKDTDIVRCVSRVAERAGRAIARVIDKSNDFSRSRPLPLDSEAFARL